jgi:AraC-like DNA-binding protein
MLTSFNRDLELVNGLETNYVRILYYVLSQNYSSSYKSYEYNRLCTILEGEKHVSVDDGSKFTYDKDKFLLLPPNSTIHMDIPVPTKALVFELNNVLLKNVTEKVSIDYDIDYNSLIKDNVLTSRLNKEIQGSITKIDSVLTKSNKNVEFLLDLYAQELVYNLIQIKGVNQVLNLETNNPVYKAVKYMHENCMSPISISQISSDLNMSDANFCQYFKKITGVTPKEYLTNLKLSKAKDMIRNASVTETAFELGYENISHFIALFKNKYGITPKQYKKDGIQN